MKTIAIDCRFASTLSGLGRYTRELTLRLLEQATDLRYVLIVRSSEESWIPKANGRFRVVSADIAHYSLAEQLYMPSIIRKTGADLLFSPHFNVPLFCPIPFVVTVHDLILHRFPNDSSLLKRIVYRAVMKSAVIHARSVCTVSWGVRSEIQAAYGDAVAGKTHVIREGVSDAYVPACDERKEYVRKKYDLRRPFFLYVGNAKQHKNVQMLLDAFAESGDTEHDFVLLTGGKESKNVRNISSRIRMISDVPEQDLPVFYSLADVFFTATLYEGFCLPVAEALACGCPVVSSDLPVIREIAEGRATFVEPTVTHFAEVMKKPPVRLSPYVVGTWQQAAKETERVLQRALSSL